VKVLVVFLIVGTLGLTGRFLWKWDQAPVSPASQEPEPAAPKLKKSTLAPVKTSLPSSAKGGITVVARGKNSSRPNLIVDRVEPAVAVAELAPAVLSAPAALPAERLPFPQVEQIAAGSSEDTVSQKYGPPNIWALTTNGGHVIGTHVYSRDRGRLATLIHFKDGKVTSAFSQSVPTPPTGIPIPRRLPVEQDQRPAR